MKAQRLACEAHSKPWGRQAEDLPWLAGLVDASAWAGLVVTTAQIDPIFLEGTPPAIKLPVRMVASP